DPRQAAARCGPGAGRGGGGLNNGVSRTAEPAFRLRPSANQNNGIRAEPRTGTSSESGSGQDTEFLAEAVARVLALRQPGRGANCFFFQQRSLNRRGPGVRPYASDALCPLII